MAWYGVPLAVPQSNGPLANFGPDLSVCKQFAFHHNTDLGGGHGRNEQEKWQGPECMGLGNVSRKV